jgi:Na+/melibiose symporter-like transporter
VSLTAIAGLVALGFYSRYHLPRARHAEIVKGLEAMRATHAANTTLTTPGRPA